MKNIKLLIGGMAAILSMGTTAFARPATPPKYNNNTGYGTGYNNNQGYSTGYGNHVSRAHFDQDLQDKILELINDVRYRKGLDELNNDSRSLKSARLVAKEAGVEGGFGDIDNSLYDRLTAQGLDLTCHVYSDISCRVYGETRAIIDEGDDVDATARKIVRFWLKSSKFSKVLLNDEISYAGVAAYVNDDGKVMVVLNAFGGEHKTAQQPQAPKGCGW